MIRLFNEDCMPALRVTMDKAYELAIVDPPYGINVANMNVGARTIKNASCDGKEWDLSTPDVLFFNELRRVSREQIIWGANYFNCFSGGMGAIVWDKENPLPTSSRCEIASYSKHSRVAYYKQTWTNYVNSKATNHPTEKPVRLYEWLLKNYAKPDDRILDTHGGSGSICIACDIMGFDLDWYETDKDYFKAAKERLERHQQQEVLDL